MRETWGMAGGSWRPMWLALAFTAAVLMLFSLWPELDLIAARAAWSGDGFAAAGVPALKAFRKSSTWVLAIAALACLWLLARAGWRRRSASGLVDAPRAATALIGLVLGPGVLVNSILKQVWGRPRPVHLEMFGGEAPYVPVWQVSRWCPENCSFTSGEGASAAWLVYAALLLPSPWRERLIGPALLYGVALSFNRVLFGGHFISDVLVSWGLVGAVMAAVYALMRPLARPRLTEELA